MKKRATLIGSMLVLTALITPGSAKIKAVTLEEMIDLTENTVYGEIVAKRCFRVDDPVAGPELYYTTITIEGRSMRDGRKLTVDLTYPGGFVNEHEGVYNSEAPSEDDSRIGARVVAFYRWSPDMGGRVPANMLMGSHGGIFRTVDGPQGRTVLGRGKGYAVPYNTRLDSLEAGVRNIVEQRLQQQGLPQQKGPK